MGSFHALERNQVIGAGIVDAFATLAACAVIFVLFRVLCLALQHFLAKDRFSSREYVFFHTQLGYYLTCLLIGNFFNSLSGLIGFRWLVDGGVTDGPLCVSQGIVMQIGNFSTAYFTIIIAVHTFLTLVLHKRQSLWVCAIFSAFGWIATATVAFSPLYFQQPFGPLYGASGLSCGIRAVYPKEQVIFHLFPIFTASVCCAVLYSLIFLVLRGTLIIKGGLRLTLGPPPTTRGLYTNEGYHQFIAAVARSMLWYPFAYILLLIPYSIVRMLSLSGFTVAFWGIALAFTFWFLLGLANVILLHNTFRVLGPAFDIREDSRDMESFGATLEYKSSSQTFNSGLGGLTRLPGTQNPLDSSLAPYESYQRQDARYSTQSGASSIGLLIPKTSLSVESAKESNGIDRAISPSSVLSQRIETNSNPSPSAISPLGHRRFGSTDTLNSLPAPPRQTRSPTSHTPRTSSVGSVNRSTETWAYPVRSSHTPSGSPTPVSAIRNPSRQGDIRPPVPAGHSSRSSTPSTLEISEWLAHQETRSPVSRNGSFAASLPKSPRTVEHLQLSAMASQTSFPSPTFSYYQSAGSPTSVSSPRPLPPLPLSPHHLTGPRSEGDCVDQNDSAGAKRPVLNSPPPGKPQLMLHKPSYSAFGGSTQSHHSQVSTHGHTIPPF